jgi:hypothetical protein
MKDQIRQESVGMKKSIAHFPIRTPTLRKLNIARQNATFLSASELPFSS